MRPPVISARIWFVVVAPILLGALLMFHPMPSGDVIYEELHDDVTPWLIVHVGLAAGAGAMAFALHQLLRGLSGRAATISRLALAPFVICFVAWEATLGIGTGVLVEYANGLPAGAERDALSAGIQDFFRNPLIGDASVIGMIGNVAWIVAVIAAALAVRRTGARTPVVILLGLSSLFTLHASMLGPIGLGCFALAAMFVERARVAAISS